MESRNHKEIFDKREATIRKVSSPFYSDEKNENISNFFSEKFLQNKQNQLQILRNKIGMNEKVNSIPSKEIPLLKEQKVIALIFFIFVISLLFFLVISAFDTVFTSILYETTSMAEGLSSALSCISDNSLSLKEIIAQPTINDLFHQLAMMLLEMLFVFGLPAIFAICFGGVLIKTIITFFKKENKLILSDFDLSLRKSFYLSNKQKMIVVSALVLVITIGLPLYCWFMYSTSGYGTFISLKTTVNISTIYDVETKSFQDFFLENWQEILLKFVRFPIFIISIISSIFVSINRNKMNSHLRFPFKHPFSPHIFNMILFALGGSFLSVLMILVVWSLSNALPCLPEFYDGVIDLFKSLFELLKNILELM